jgi:hypothetical protein
VLPPVFEFIVRRGDDLLKRFETDGMRRKLIVTSVEFNSDRRKTNETHGLIIDR